MTCPGCNGQMIEVPLHGHYGRPLVIDLCHACNSVWFDGGEDVSLAPTAVIALFEEMGAAARTAKAPIANRKVCPRCHTGLLRTLDQARNTPYEYFRCSQKHGRFLSFASFLRARHFVRDLTDAEIQTLGHSASIIKCVNCGASIDIKAHSACEFCRAPVAVLDANQLSKTLADLEAAHVKRATLDPTWPLRAAQARRQTEAVFTELNRGAGASADVDLVQAGLTAFADVLRELGD